MYLMENLKNTLEYTDTREYKSSNLQFVWSSDPNLARKKLSSFKTT